VLTVEQRVKRGIEWLDNDTKNIVSKNWRSLIRLDNLRFANPNKGPLGQLFGDYVTGLKKLRIIGGGSDYGFRSQYRKLGDPTDLKLAWAKALKTDPSWKNLGHSRIRLILGIRYVIFVDDEGIYRVGFIKSGLAHKYPNRFTSYSSSKRFVRKLISQKQI
jgi:hypothetical protein